MLVLCLIICGKAFAGTLGTHAIGTQILFFTVSTVGSYVLSFGLPPGCTAIWLGRHQAGKPETLHENLDGSHA